MQSLRKVIGSAEDEHKAIGHFNISDSEQLRAIFTAASNLKVPAIIGTSEGERDFLGVRQAVALVRSIREEFDYPIFINADHTYSYERVREAVDAGYDSVIFDGTKLPFDENVKITKQCVDYAREKNPEILVEGEIGYIGKSSKLLDEIPKGAEISDEHLTKPDEIKRYVEETGLDLVAPAVGNLHGMLKNGRNPALNVELVKSLREAGGIPLVLHGGSGISDEDFTSVIDSGVAIIHVNTEIRVAYRKGIQRSLQKNPDEVAPYRFMKGGVQEVAKVVEERLKLFSRI
jgi:fructose-bisphosphate aldolase, class II